MDHEIEFREGVYSPGYLMVQRSPSQFSSWYYHIHKTHRPRLCSVRVAIIVKETAENSTSRV